MYFTESSITKRLSFNIGILCKDSRITKQNPRKGKYELNVPESESDAVLFNYSLKLPKVIQLHGYESNLLSC